MVVALLVAAASFLYSHHLLRVNPSAAYFSSFGRAWELALGALLAIGIRWVTRVPAAVRLAAGWIGLACIGAAAVAFSSHTPFPGKAALLPTLGAALVIASGVREHEERRHAGRLLGTLPLRYVGDRSYTFYLWHWPFLAIAVLYEGRKLPVAANVLLLAIAFGLSIVTYRYFENPIRRMKWKGSVGVLLWPVSVGVVLAVAFAGIGAIQSTAAAVPTPRAAIQPAILVGPSSPHGLPALPAVIASVRAALHGAPIPSRLVPAFIKLPTDWFPYPPRCVAQRGQTHSAICYLKARSAAPSSTPTPRHKTLVVLGDSHADMWDSSLFAMAAKDRWDVVSVSKLSCTPAVLYADAASPDGPGTLAECHAWYRWALRTIARLHPNTIFISFHYNGDRGNVAMKAENGISSLTDWAKTVARHVVLMADVPNLQSLPQPVDCLQESGATLRTCTGTWSGSSLDLSRTIEARARLQHVGVIDPLGWFCYRGLCPQAIGETIAFKDTDHVTQTYATALSPPFRAAFRAALHAG